MKLSAAQLEGEIGTSITLKTSVFPKNATVQKVTFASSDTAVAKVSPKGKVSFLSIGTATITATAQDGSLVLKPVKTVGADGNVSYTSGRVNAQNKHNFKYGLFEARVKVPEGQGFLPTFWMMLANENLYGQWPRCGELDIMEVMCQKTDTSYGTIHYGNPHSESQGTCTLDKGTFSDEYHIFSAEWEPGRINWYVDRNLIHTENDWYSATEGQGEITYPAPFDQPFYIILNLDNEAKTVLSNGNYVYNGSFQEGAGRLGYWNVIKPDGAQVSVTNTDNIRKLRIVALQETSATNPVIISQKDLALAGGGKYALSFSAEGEAGKRMIVTAAGKTFETILEGAEKNYICKFKTETELSARACLKNHSRDLHSPLCG